MDVFPERWCTRPVTNGGAFVIEISHETHIPYIYTCIVVCVDVNSCMYSDSMLQFQWQVMKSMTTAQGCTPRLC